MASKRKSSKTSSKAGPSTSSTPRPWEDMGITLSNEIHQKRFTRLHTRKVTPTKFRDNEVLTLLGIFDDVTLLLNRIGFEGFTAKGPVITSRRLTLEFLSTLERTETTTDRGDEVYDRISFQLMNRTFTSDYFELNGIFGFDPEAPLKGMVPTSDEENLDDSEFSAQQVWTILTEDPFFYARRSKSSHIIHPAVRYVHRMLVYTIWGRNELGAMSDSEMKALWLMTRERDDDYAFPINYAEHFIDRMVLHRDGIGHSKDIIMGGMVTYLAQHFVRGFDIAQVDSVSKSILLDTKALTITFKFMDRAGDDIFIWRVQNFPWCDLPNPAATRLEGREVPNPFYVPRTYDPTREEREAREAENREVRQQQPQQQQGQEVGRRRLLRGESSTSAASFDISSLQHELSAIRLSIDENERRRQREMEYQTFYLRGLYSAQVQAGNIEPYLNYPFHPPQEGPVPGWHGNQPTYPYYPTRPEGIDYRYPGGSDFRLDPNVPPFDSYPVYPPNYHSIVPPMEQTWGTAPMPDWGNYSGNQDNSSTMDED